MLGARSNGHAKRHSLRDPARARSPRIFTRLFPGRRGDPRLTPEQRGIVLEAVLEIVFSFVGELFMDLGWDMVSHVLQTKRRRRTALGSAGWFFLGLGVGALSAWIHPAHFFHSRRIRLAILFVAPLFAGIVMHIYGRSKQLRGKNRSSLATFAGGALFALGLHSVRFFWR
jgi:hypothetical protein